MQIRIKPWMWLIALAAFTFTPFSLAQEDEDSLEQEEEEEEEEENGEGIEELTVTGSFIRRDNFDLPSPLHVTDELDIELAGTQDMGDIIFDQTFQFGVNANAAPFEGNAADDQQWNQGSEVWANIRGLGTRATMTMMDSRRLPADTNTWGRRTGVDVNNTYPQIAVGRVETILDGASALYGAEAVAGVINIIPNKNFEGLRVNYHNQQAIDKGAPNQAVSIIAGAQGERTKAVFSVELRDIDQMTIVDARPEYIISVQSEWGNQRLGPAWHDAGARSNPGDWYVPMRDANGDLIPDPTPTSQGLYDNLGGIQRYRAPWGDEAPLADPGCAYGFGAGHDDWGEPPPGSSAADGVYVYNDLAKRGSFLNGTIAPWAESQCIMTLPDMQDMQAEQEQYKGFAFFEHEFNDYVKVHGEVVFTVLDYYTRDVTGGIDEIPTETRIGNRVPIAIGSNPGNPWRAFAPGSWFDGSGLGNRPGDTAGFSYVHDIWGQSASWRAYANRVAYVDENGNGLYDYLDEPGELFLFAQDADGDGIPDRTYDGSDETCTIYTMDDGTEVEECIPAADPGATRKPEARVILLSNYNDSDGDGIPDRYDPDSVGNGGVHLFEDVRMPYGALNINPKQPRNNTIEYLLDEGFLMYKRRAQRDNIRIRVGTTINIPDSEWIVDADVVYARGKRERQYPEPQWWLYVDALRCQGGREGNECWNPFSTTYLNTDEYGQFLGDESVKFPDEDDPGWRPFDDPAVNTERENKGAGHTLEYNLQTLGMELVDLVFSNGNFFTLPYNDAPAGFAIGFHNRLETEEYRSSVINQSRLGGGARGLRESGQRSTAIFSEIQLPLIQHEFWGEMELQVALRYAEIYTFGKIGQPGSVRFNTTIPKVALRYSPVDWLSFRASLTEGFVTPGLYALFGEPGQYGGQRTGGSTGGSQLQSVGDYVCDELPELVSSEDCFQAGTGANAQQVIVIPNANQELGAEYSDLWNAGISFRLFEGSLVMDVDYSTVRFNGKAEQLDATNHVNSNRIGFEDFMLSRCPGTVLDWDNASEVTEETHPDFFVPNPGQEQGRRINAGEYIEMFPEDAACRLSAVKEWITSAANDGVGEKGFGSARILRGGGENGLGLTEVDRPWVEQGEQETDTLIYALYYSFDAQDIPFIGGDYGSFGINVSATQMLKMANTLWKQGSAHPLAGITVDGVGYRNQDGSLNDGTGSDIFAALPPTPEWRVSLGLRWFKDNHILQLSGNWHDEIEDVNPAWEVYRERGLLSQGQQDRYPLGVQPCAHEQTNRACQIDSNHYWNLSYSYSVPDLFSFSEVHMNFAIRNLFDTFPDPHNRATGHEPYLDNIMGRQGYMSLTFNF